MTATPVLKLPLYERIRTAIYLEVERIEAKRVEDLTPAQVVALGATAGIGTVGRVVMGGANGDELEISLVAEPVIAYADGKFKVEVSGDSVDAQRRAVNLANLNGDWQPPLIEEEVIMRLIPAYNGGTRPGGNAVGMFGFVSWTDFGHGRFVFSINGIITDYSKMRRQDLVDIMRALKIEVRE